MAGFPERIVLMGVSGTGKSRIGALLAPRIGAGWVEGDSLHPPGNLARMARGELLTDADRLPWLRLVGQAFSRGHTVIGCSALKRSYRDLIRQEAGSPVTFVHLAGSRDLIAGRMQARTGHFMAPSLLASQFEALEPPGPDEDAVTVDVAPPPENVVAAICDALTRR